MRRVIAAINMTLDGYCDHTAAIVDDELHRHYSDLLRNAGALLYGRVTYQLMESFWPNVVEEPTGNKATDDFAVLIDGIPKIVFSRTLKSIEWKTARLAKSDLKDEVLQLKKQPGKDIFAGSPSLIVALTKLNMIDEYQLCVHPMIAGYGLPLFKEIDRVEFKLLKSKTLKGGHIILYYERGRNELQ